MQLKQYGIKMNLLLATSHPTKCMEEVFFEQLIYLYGENHLDEISKGNDNKSLQQYDCWW